MTLQDLAYLFLAVIFFGVPVVIVLYLIIAKLLGIDG